MRYELLKKLTAPAKAAIERMPGSAFVQGVMPIVNFPGQILGSTAYGVGKQIANPETADFNKDTTEAMRALQYEPPSKAGKEYQEALMHALEVSKLPPYMGHMPPMRFNANDARVLAKQNIERAREFKNIPEDFANAKSGFQRESNLGGQTYGAQLQGAANEVGDVMARRQARGESAIPGVQVFSDLVPETNLYAVRPSGSQSQVIREVPTALNPRYNVTDESRLTSELQRTLGRSEPTQDLEIRTREQPFTNFVPDNFGKSANELFKDFIMPKLAAEFPGLQNEDLLRAAQVKYGSGLNTWMKSQLEEFARLPETQAYNVAAMSTVENNPDRFENRLNTLHDVLVVPPSVKLEGMKAGDSWVMRNLQNYFVEHVGTPTDPMFDQILQTGKTPIPVAELEDYASDNARTATSFRNRVGMPTEGVMRPKLVEKAPELRNVEAQLEQLQTEFNNLVNANPGIQPAQIPGIKELYKEKAKLTKVKDKLVTQIDNIEKAIMYEDYMDAKVRPTLESNFVEDLNPTFAQRFPMIPTNKKYMYQIDMPEAFQELGSDVVRELELGLITPEAAKSLSVPSAAKMKAELQAQREKALATAEKLNTEQLKSYILQETQSLPQDGAYGKGTVVKFDSSLSKDQMERALSSETEWMDHCIGRGGSPDNRTLSRKAKALGVSNVGNDDKYLGYVPMTLAHKPGRVVPKGSAGTSTTYMNDFRSGEAEGRSFRDTATGVPFATMKLVKITGGENDGKYRVGEFYGYKDHAVEGPWYEGKEGPYTPEEKKEYRQVIADWANDHADQLASVNSEGLHRFANIYDAKSSDHKRSLASYLGINESELNSVIQEAGKRFITADEAKAAKQALQSQVSTMSEVESLKETEKDIERALRYGHYADDDEESLLRSQLREVRDELQQLEQRNQQVTVPGVENAFNEYMSWLNDRHPTIQSRLDQIGDDISDINRGHMTAGQFGLNPQEFEAFERALGREQRNLIGQRNAGIQQQVPEPREVQELTGVLDQEMNRIRDNYDEEVYNSVDGTLTSINDNYDLTADPHGFIARVRANANAAQRAQDLTMYDILTHTADLLERTTRENEAILNNHQQAAQAPEQLHDLLAPRDIADRVSAPAHQALPQRINQVQALTEAINEEIRSLPTTNDGARLQQAIEFYEDPNNLPNAITDHTHRYEDAEMIAAQIRAHAQNRLVLAPAPQQIQAEPNTNVGNVVQNLINQYPERNQVQALINDLERGSYDELPMAIINADEIVRDDTVSEIIGQLEEYRDGLRAPQLHAPRNNTRANPRYTTDDAIEALDEGFRFIEQDLGDNALDFASTQNNEVAALLDPAYETERYIEELRHRASNVRGNNRTALNILADELESLYMRDWEAEPLQQLPPPEGHKRGGSIRKMKDGGEYNLPDLGNDEEEPRQRMPFIPPAMPYAAPGVSGAKINRAIPIDKHSAVTLSADVSRSQNPSGTNYNVNEFGGGYHHKVGPGMLGVSGSHRPGTHENRVNVMYAIPMKDGGSIQSSKNRLLSPNTDEMRFALMKGK
jgi:hypothetical protein